MTDELIPTTLAPRVSVPQVVRTGAGTAEYFQVAVSNPSNEPTAYTVALAGVEASWLPQPVTTPVLEPHTTYNVTLTLHPDAGSLPAKYPVALTARATTPGSAVEIVNFDLVVNPRTELTMELKPESISGWRGKNFSIFLRNTGSIVAEAFLRPVSSSALDFHITDDELFVPPGTVMEIKGRATVKRKMWVGSSIRHVMRIVGHGNEAERHVTGEFIQKPVFSTTLLKIIGVITVLAVWLGAGIVFLPKLTSAFDINKLTDVTITQTTDDGSDGGSGGSGDGGSGSSQSDGSSSGDGGADGGATGSAADIKTIQLNGTISAADPSGVAVSVEPISLVDEQAISDANVQTVGFSLSALTTSGKVERGALLRAPADGTAQNLSMTTSDDGQWGFAGIASPGYYLVTFTKAGYQTQRVVIDSATHEATEPVAIDLASGQGTISGHIYGADGAALGGADITVTNGSITFTASSNSTGSDIGAWEMSGLSTPMTYTVSASRSGLSEESSIVALSAGGSGTVDLTLHTSSTTIHGTVTGESLFDGSTGGIGNAVVTLYGPDGEEVATTKTTTSATNRGGFTFTDIAVPSTGTQVYSVTVEADGYDSATKQGIVIDSILPDGASDIALTQSNWKVQGCVLNGGSPLSNVGVTITNADNTFKGLTTSATSCPNFTIYDVVPGTYTVQATRNGFTYDTGSGTGTVTITSSTSKTIPVSVSPDISLTGTPPGSISVSAGITGQVTDGTTGIAGATVQLRLNASEFDSDGNPTGSTVKTATTDGSGNYTLSGLEPGFYRVTATKGGYTSTTVTRNVDTTVLSNVTITLASASAAGAQLNGAFDTYPAYGSAGDASDPLNPLGGDGPYLACVLIFADGVTVGGHTPTANDLNCTSALQLTGRDASGYSTTVPVSPHSLTTSTSDYANALSTAQYAVYTTVDANGLYRVNLPKAGTYHVVYTTTNPDYVVLGSGGFTYNGSTAPATYTGTGLAVSLGRLGRATVTVKWLDPTTGASTLANTTGIKVKAVPSGASESTACPATDGVAATDGVVCATTDGSGVASFTSLPYGATAASTTDYHFVTSQTVSGDTRAWASNTYALGAGSDIAVTAPLSTHISGLILRITDTDGDPVSGVSATVTVNTFDSDGDAATRAMPTLTTGTNGCLLITSGSDDIDPGFSSADCAAADWGGANFRWNDVPNGIAYSQVTLTASASGYQDAAGVTVTATAVTDPLVAATGGAPLVLKATTRQFPSITLGSDGTAPDWADATYTVTRVDGADSTTGQASPDVPYILADGTFASLCDVDGDPAYVADTSDCDTPASAVAASLSTPTSSTLVWVNPYGYDGNPSVANGQEIPVGFYLVTGTLPGYAPVTAWLQCSLGGECDWVDDDSDDIWHGYAQPTFAQNGNLTFRMSKQQVYSPPTAQLYKGATFTLTASSASFASASDCPSGFTFTAGSPATCSASTTLAGSATDSSTFFADLPATTSSTNPSAELFGGDYTISASLPTGFETDSTTTYLCDAGGSLPWPSVETAISLTPGQSLTCTVYPVLRSITGSVDEVLVSGTPSIDGDQRPLENATVALERCGTGSDATTCATPTAVTDATVLTDEDGLFRIDGLTQSTYYRVTASKTDWSTVSASAIVQVTTATGDFSPASALTLRAPTTTYDFTVPGTDGTGTFGKPVTVQFRLSGTSAWVEASDADGAFSVALVPGLYDYRLVADNLVGSCADADDLPTACTVAPDGYGDPSGYAPGLVNAGGATFDDTTYAAQSSNFKLATPYLARTNVQGSVAVDLGAPDLTDATVYLCQSATVDCAGDMPVGVTGTPLSVAPDATGAYEITDVPAVGTTATAENKWYVWASLSGYSLDADGDGDPDPIGPVTVLKDTAWNSLTGKDITLAVEKRAVSVTLDSTDDNADWHEATISLLWNGDGSTDYGNTANGTLGSNGQSTFSGANGIASGSPIPVGTYTYTISGISSLVQKHLPASDITGTVTVHAQGDSDPAVEALTIAIVEAKVTPTATVSAVQNQHTGPTTVGTDYTWAISGASNGLAATGLDTLSPVYLRQDTWTFTPTLTSSFTTANAWWTPGAGGVSVSSTGVQSGQTAMTFTEKTTEVTVSIAGAPAGKTVTASLAGWTNITADTDSDGDAVLHLPYGAWTFTAPSPPGMGYTVSGTLGTFTPTVAGTYRVDDALGGITWTPWTVNGSLATLLPKDASNRAVTWASSGTCTGTGNSYTGGTIILAYDDTCEVAATATGYAGTLTVKVTGVGTLATDDSVTQWFSDISVTAANATAVTATCNAAWDAVAGQNCLGGTTSDNTPSSNKFDLSLGYGMWDITVTAATGYTADSMWAFDGTTETDSSSAHTFNQIHTSYTVTVLDDGHGTASAGASTAHYNDSINIAKTPNPGYNFSGWTVVPSSLTIGVGATSFTMPASNVSLTANFTGWTKTVGVTIGAGSAGTGSISFSAACANATTGDRDGGNAFTGRNTSATLSGAGTASLTLPYCNGQWTITTSRTGANPATFTVDGTNESTTTTSPASFTLVASS